MNAHGGTIHRIDVGGAMIHVTVQRAAAALPAHEGGRNNAGDNAGDNSGANGRALICLHGGPGIDGSGQRLMFSQLTDVADVVVPDQRGHGLSDLSTPDEWTLDTWADDLATVIDELGLDRPVVFGISFGGWVAIRHAARHPEQASGLIVASMTPKCLNVEETARRMGDLAGPAAEQAWLRVHDDPSEEAVADMRRLCMPLMAQRAPSPELAAVRAAQRQTPQVNEHFTPRFHELDLREEFRAVDCPTLVILGELDPFVSKELVAMTAASLPARGELITLPDVAHDLFADAPDTLLDKVRRFVLAAF